MGKEGGGVCCAFALACHVLGLVVIPVCIGHHASARQVVEAVTINRKPSGMVLYRQSGGGGGERSVEGQIM
jgi:hypothetical protein